MKKLFTTTMVCVCFAISVFAEQKSYQILEQKESSVKVLIHDDVHFNKTMNYFRNEQDFQVKYSKAYGIISIVRVKESKDFIVEMQPSLAYKLMQSHYGFTANELAGFNLLTPKK